MLARRALAGLAAALLVVACTDSKSPGSGASSGSGGPRTGGVLRIGIERPASLDPAAASPTAQGELLMADVLFDGLPALSTPTSSADLRTWTFRLRPDATFSDGHPIRAADVRA